MTACDLASASYRRALYLRLFSAILGGRYRANLFGTWAHTIQAMEISETPRAHHWSLTLLGMALVVMFAYYGESVLAVLFFAILLSFMLSPVVQALEYLHLPRAPAALISVVVLLAVLFCLSASSYNQTLIFAAKRPKYLPKIRSLFQPFPPEA